MKKERWEMVNKCWQFGKVWECGDAQGTKCLDVRWIQSHHLGIAFFFSTIMTSPMWVPPYGLRHLCLAPLLSANWLNRLQSVSQHEPRTHWGAWLHPFISRDSYNTISVSYSEQFLHRKFPVLVCGWVTRI